MVRWLPKDSAHRAAGLCTGSSVTESQEGMGATRDKYTFYSKATPFQMHREQRYQAAIVLETGEIEVLGHGASHGAGLESEPQEAGVTQGCIWRGAHSAGFPSFLRDTDMKVPQPSGYCPLHSWITSPTLGLAGYTDRH